MRGLRFAVPLIVAVLLVDWISKGPPSFLAIVTTALTADKLPVWADMLKTFFATFLGAALAFASNQMVTSFRERKDQLAAARAATFTLSRMMNNRHNILDGIERFQREKFIGKGVPITSVPMWLRVPPIFHVIEPDFDFDYDSLDFLYARPGQPMEHLNIAALGHRALVSDVNTYRDARIEAQKKQDTDGINHGSTSAEAELAAGPRLVHLMNQTAGLVLERLPLTDNALNRAATLLEEALKSHFKRKGFPRLLEVIGLLDETKAPGIIAMAEPIPA